MSISNQIPQSRFVLPDWVKRHDSHETNNAVPSEEIIAPIRERLKKFNTEDPEVSIVIPAYNEEKSILKALSSLSEVETKYRTELIVANNNSKDNTQKILDLCGVKSVFETNQGISYARQAGLQAARGKYIVNADSDSIYPPSWVDLLVEPLLNKNISCSYGTYSFIPGERTSRLALSLYESAAELLFMLKSKNRECVNVMGFNFAFRKNDGMDVGGYNHNLQRKITGRSEDGWMALCLMQKGNLQRVKNNGARVWTSDRRLMDDGSLGNAFQKRVKKEIGRLKTYLTAPNQIGYGSSKVLE